MENSNSSHTNGYAVIRKIGEGGFGEVFVAKKGGNYYAVKRLFPTAAKREIHGIKKFFELKNGVSAGTLPIVEILEYWTDANGSFSYSMPLADGHDAALSPESPFWFAKSLYSEITKQNDEPNWFSRKYIENVAERLFDAACILSSRGILHRDIKPDNILFFGGQPKLADMGLLTNDTPSVSAMGTPDYLPPSWYLRTHGDPDMWGVAATLYTLITGFSPDTLGREAYMFPHQNKKLLSAEEIERWEHWHSCILRATHERAAERFKNMEDFKACFFGKKLSPIKTARQTSTRGTLWALRFVVAIGIVLFALYTICEYGVYEKKRIDSLNVSRAEKARIEEYYKNKSRVYRADLKNALPSNFRTKHNFPESVKIDGFTPESLNNGTYYSLRQKTIEKYINNHIEDLVDIDKSIESILGKSLNEIRNTFDTPILKDEFDKAISKEEIYKAFEKDEPITKNDVCKRVREVGFWKYFSGRNSTEYIDVKDFPKYKVFEDKFKAHCDYKIRGKVYRYDLKNALPPNFYTKHIFPESVEIKGFTLESLNNGTYHSLKQKAIEEYINSHIADLVTIDKSVKSILDKLFYDILKTFGEPIVPKEEIFKAFEKDKPITKNDVCKRVKEVGFWKYFSGRNPTEYIDVKDYPKYNVFEDKFKESCKPKLTEWIKNEIKKRIAADSNDTYPHDYDAYNEISKYFPKSKYQNNVKKIYIDGYYYTCKSLAENGIVFDELKKSNQPAAKKAVELTYKLDLSLDDFYSQAFDILQHLDYTNLKLRKFAYGSLSGEQLLAWERDNLILKTKQAEFEKVRSKVISDDKIRHQAKTRLQWKVSEYVSEYSKLRLSNAAKAFIPIGFIEKETSKAVEDYMKNDFSKNSAISENIWSYIYALLKAEQYRGRKLRHIIPGEDSLYEASTTSVGGEPLYEIDRDFYEMTHGIINPKLDPSPPTRERINLNGTDEERRKHEIEYRKKNRFPEQ